MYPKVNPKMTRISLEIITLCPAVAFHILAYAQVVLHSVSLYNPERGSLFIYNQSMPFLNCFTSFSSINFHAMTDTTDNNTRWCLNTLAIPRYPWNLQNEWQSSIISIPLRIIIGLTIAHFIKYLQDVHLLTLGNKMRALLVFLLIIVERRAYRSLKWVEKG